MAHAVAFAADEQFFVGNARTPHLQSRRLNDRRIVFFVSTEKLHGLGMLATEVGNLRSTYSVIQYAGATLAGRSWPLSPANRARPACSAS